MIVQYGSLLNNVTLVSSPDMRDDMCSFIKTMERF